jgi:hypothetical protein
MRISDITALNTKRDGKKETSRKMKKERRATH